MTMRRLLFATTAMLLVGCGASLAQVSTMGSTAMGLPSTPGVIVTSPLNGPSPFSAVTQPGTAVTTLAPVPLASDPTIPGTVVTCSTPTGQITPGTAPVTSLSAFSGTMPPVPTTSSATFAPSAADSSTAPLPLSATPATSFLTDLPGSTTPAPSFATGASASPPPSVSTIPAPTTTPGTVSTFSTGSTAVMTPGTVLGTIPTLLGGSTTGTIAPASPLGSSQTTVCSSTPGGPPTNGAALPLSTPEIPNSPAPGTIQPTVADLGGTSIDPTTMAVMPTPNTSACAESVTMSLANPGMMTPANATGATATPGVTPAGC
jgi:hypothetical protein